MRDDDPVFLTAEQVEAFHQRALELHGGSDGLRDRPLFEGAVEQAQNVYWYGHGDLFDVAAALTFLKLNGVNTRVELTMPLYNALIEVAERRLDREGLAQCLRELLT
jgi:death-on-curing protein